MSTFTKDAFVKSDQYHNSFLIPKDEILEAAVENSAANGLPDIAVSAAQGKFLSLLAKSIGAKRILEVGTLGGYSTIWLSRALPADGKLITCELSPKHAEVARANIANAGFADKAEVLVGPAADTLKGLNPPEPFDLAFIDADKPSNVIYFKEAERLVKSGGVIIVDNVVRQGKVADTTVEPDANSKGVRALLEYLKTNTEVDATTIATVGEKGFDGFLYAVRK
ncbi:O-methyltransferase family 3 protein [Punctularia strigosozonata HHB-11173 SS5]|uniref:O-methyltransferase family 3 protein n=1 Tax=Punctularia strigosozonata (strain HHB-11173) TaxID=741275 RepID=UPI00044167F0|nr:O-methyltransferase family 3 protein [Punctularia strigosozonata HHB-11173 SS5]EIN07397.1 O-methyltransferase family 3 protein [Punctularia strigosozonata HHB-11173 SS5]